MWLRDSTNQVLPYLPFASEDPKLESMLCGLVLRQASNVLIDPYANAFNQNPNGNGHQDDIRIPSMTKSVFEGKYELDSLAAFLKLSYGVYNWTGKSLNCVEKKKDMWFQAVNLTYHTIKTQQAGSEEELENPPYSFQRMTTQATDTLMMFGRGTPAQRCGLSKSPFRGSDDAVTLPFQVAANAMASVELRHVAEMLKTKAFGGEGLELARKMETLAGEIEEALHIVGLMKDVDGKRYYAYEVDGYGGQYFMDDANIPGLLSLPYLGFCSKDDPLYLKTRELVLSSKNPYYFKGTAGEGVGGPHIGLGYIWPMGILTRAITSDNDDEILESLEMIKGASTAINLPFMHESYWKNNASDYTRSWFAWANTLFGEVMLTLARERPHLIFKAKELQN
jgi:meiotically up-regulated gene 157 (Mug157) protein